MNKYIDRLINYVILLLDKILTNLRSRIMARPKKEAVTEGAVVETQVETSVSTESSVGESVKPVVESKKAVLTHRALGVAEVPGKGHAVVEVMFNPLTLEAGDVKFVTGFEPKSEAEFRFKIKAVELGVLGR